MASLSVFTSVGTGARVVVQPERTEPVVAADGGQIGFVPGQAQCRVAIMWHQQTCRPHLVLMPRAVPLHDIVSCRIFRLVHKRTCKHQPASLKLILPNDRPNLKDRRA